MSKDFNWLHDAWTDKKELHNHVIVTNRFDREDMTRMLEEVAQFDRARENLGKFTPTGIEAATDAFMAFFKGLPIRRDISEMDPEHFINHTVDRELANLPETQRLRRSTVGDDVQAALAVEQIEPDLETLFDRIHQEQTRANELRDLLDQLTQTRQEKHDVDEMVERWRGENPPPAPVEDADQGQGAQGDPGDDAGEGQDGQSGAGQADGQPQAGGGQEGTEGANELPQDLADQQAEASNSLNELEAKVEQAMEAMTQDLERVSSEARHALRGAVNRAADQAEDFQRAAAAWGMDPGDLHRLPADERLALAKRLNTPYFRRIADLFGPMKNLMFTEQTRKVDYATEEVFDVGMGSDLSRMLPSELLNLELNEDDFLRRYSEGKLLQYDMRGEERLARGGIIFCEDGSGSMRGEKEMWAKAVMLCLLHLARQQNRPFHLIHFASAQQAHLISFERPEDYTLNLVLDAAEYFFGGGTHFETPMAISLEILREQFARNGAVKSDVVWATDDECSVNETFMAEYLKESERMQFTTYGFSITPYAPDPDGALAQMTEGKVMQIKDILSGENIREVFRSL